MLNLDDPSIYIQMTHGVSHWTHQLVAGTCSPCVKPPWFSKTVVFFRGKPNHPRGVSDVFLLSISSNPSHNSYIYTYITLLQYIYIYRPIWVAHISIKYPSYNDHSQDISNLLWSSIPMGISPKRPGLEWKWRSPLPQWRWNKSSGHRRPNHAWLVSFFIVFYRLFITFFS